MPSCYKSPAGNTIKRTARGLLPLPARARLLCALQAVLTALNRVRAEVGRLQGFQAQLEDLQVAVELLELEVGGEGQKRRAARYVGAEEQQHWR